MVRRASRKTRAERDPAAWGGRVRLLDETTTTKTANAFVRLKFGQEFGRGRLYERVGSPWSARHRSAGGQTVARHMVCRMSE